MYRAVVLLAIALYLSVFLSLESLPLLDLPNHLARAAILRSLFFDTTSPFALLFGFEWMFNTYLLGDGLLIALLWLFDFQTAGRVFIVISFLFFPLSVLLYARQRGLSQSGQWLLGAAMLFLSANWFFLTGFLNYQLSLGLAFLTLLFFERYLQKPSVLRWLIYALLVALSYFMHLAAFVLCGATVASLLAIRLFQRRVSWWRSVACAVIFVAVLFLHLVASTENGDGTSLLATLEFRGVLNKLAAIGSMFFRFSLPVDAALCLIFALLCLLPFLRWKVRNGTAQAPWFEYLFLSLVSFVVYCALPVAMHTAYDVDNRALPFVFTFALLGALAFLEQLDQTSHRVMLQRMQILSALLCVADSLYLWNFLPAEDRRAVQYEQLVEQLPVGCKVLPVATVSDIGRIQSTLHLGSFYTVQKAGYTPYLFSRTESHPQTYFFYKNRGYAPDIFWYLRDMPVDWTRVLGYYDLMIVTKPFDPARFKPEALTSPIAENDAAVVFRLSEVGC